MKKRKAQSILEYVIVLTVIVAAIITAMNGVFRQKITNSFNNTANTIENATQRLPGNS